MSTHRPEPDDASGHYQTAGYAIAGLGVIVVIFATLTSKTFPQDFGFITQRGMLFFSALFIVVGGLMVRSADNPSDDQ